MHVISLLTDRFYERKSVFIHSVFFRVSKKTIVTIFRELIIWRLICYVFYAVTTFILQIKVVIEDIFFSMPSMTLSLGYLTIPFIIYCVGTYLTLLPYYVVFILLFIPSKIAIPILSLAVVFGFFSVLVI